MSFRQEFDQAVQKIEEEGLKYAEAKSKSWYSEELKGSLLSSIIAKQTEKLPQWKAELEAKNSQDYRTYLRETAEEIKRELVCKARYEKAKAQFEALRSLSSLEKAAINKFE